MEDATPNKFLKILIASWSFVFVIFAAFTSFAYMRYGSLVHSDVITDFPDDIFGKISRIGISIVVMCCYPQIVAPMLTPLDEIMQAEERLSYSPVLNDGEPASQT